MMKNILVCCPVYNEYDSLKPLLRKLLKSNVHNFQISSFSSCSPDESRNEAISNSNLCWPKLNHDLFLTIDSDMVPSVDQIYDLIDCIIDNDDVDIVSGVYRANSSIKQYVVSLDGNRLMNEKMKGMQQVKMTNFGCTVTKREIFEKIPKPWFERITVKYVDNEMEKFSLISGDFVFCEKVINVGGKIWCNFDIEVHHNRRTKEQLQDRLKI